MAVGDTHVFLGFLTSVVTQLSFQSHRLLFSHAPEVRGENTPEKKIRLNRVSNLQPTSHEFFYGFYDSVMTCSVSCIKEMHSSPRLSEHGVINN